MSGFWTDERVVALRKHHADGLSAAQSAGKLGHGCTRNMVVAKRHRLGLKDCRPASAPRTFRASEPKSKAAPKPKPALKIAGNGAIFEEPEPRTPFVRTLFVEGTGGLRIIDEGFGGCRWPLSGEGVEIRFCCASREDGASYCTDHARRAYQPTSSAKQRARSVRGCAAA